ncbi:MAG: Arylsulfatase [candidate division BRC1 bacterium ADurb.BinA364]|nr:MAG: Arylsulfatase [candidate division BRC1 bacterium ADurb.BinA364]
MRIVFIMLDTFRYDALAMGGAKLNCAPDLNEFARSACFFEHQYVSSFPTVPNREDIMTGKYSFPHRGWGPLPRESRAMAEIFRDAGYLTQLICDTPHLIGSGHQYHRGFRGYNWIRGNECDIYMTKYNHPIPSAMPKDKTRIDAILFDHYLADLQLWINPEAANEQETFAAKTGRAASQWIEDNYKCRDFLLWIDMFELHEPYIPPLYLREKYDPDYKGKPMVYPRYGDCGPCTPEEIRNMAMLYAGEVELTSKWVGYILRKLRDTGIYDDTLVAVTSDHGHYIGEHNRMGKFWLAGPKRNVIAPWIQYDEVNRIPLIVKMPGQSRGRRIRELTQPVDYLPTLLDLAKIDSGLALDGLSLAGPLLGKKTAWPRTQTYSSFSIRDRHPNFWTAINTPKWQLHLGGEAGDGPVLYDRALGPANETNIAKENPRVVRRMGGEYLRFLESVGTADAKIELMRQSLESL